MRNGILYRQTICKVRGDNRYELSSHTFDHVVSRARLKGRNNVNGSLSDVESVCHLTANLRAYSTTQTKMADEVDDLFLFGEDFDAIFDILEEEDSVEKEFADAVANVSMIN